MKTCKRFLAMMLTLAMVLSVCAFTVSADEATAEDVVVITTHNFEDQTVGTSKTSGNFGGGTADKKSIAFNLRSASNGLAAVIREDATGNNYLEAKNNYMGYNVSLKASDTAKLVDISKYPVMAVSYDLMIPKDDPYRERTRVAAFAWGPKTDTTSGDVTTYVFVADGKIYGKSGTFTTAISNEIEYTYGEWVHLEARVWINEDGVFETSVYAAGVLVYVGVSATTGVGHGGNQFNFSCYDNAAGDSRGSKGAEGNVETVTNFDNISIKFYPSSKAIENISDLEDLVGIINMKADKLSPVKDETTGWTETEGVRTIQGGKAGSGVAIIESGDLTSGVALVQGSNSVSDVNYQIVEANDRKALKVTSTDYVYTVQNAFRRMPLLTRGNGEYTFVIDYDMMIPSGSEDAQRKWMFSFGLDSAGSPDKLKKYGLALTGYYENGEVYFMSTKGDEYGSLVDGTRKSETRTVASDEWFTMTQVFKVTRDEEGFNFAIYGIYANEVIYYNEQKIAFEDRDGKGTDDEFSFVQSSFQVGKPTSSESVDTYIDNIKAVKNQNFSWEGINTNAWSAPAGISFAKDGDNLAVVGTSVANKKFTTEVMLVAIFNANGKMVELIPVTTLTDAEKTNSFNYTVPASKISAGMSVKAFIVDGITSAKPVMEMAKYSVK